MVSATSYMGNSLNNIATILDNCPQFKLNVNKMKDIAQQMESPYTLYAKALVTEGFKHFESTSYLETAVANYRNDLYFDFGRFLGYTMFLLTGGKSNIKPANEALVAMSYTEQVAFYGHILPNYERLHDKGLNKSVRSISSIFTDKIK